jgi:PKD repeat protein
MLSLIASFLMSMIIVSSHADMATLAVDPAETVQAGGAFVIYITVDDVEAMWGYQVKLVYDTNVLTATDFIGLYPFESMWVYDLNEAEGYAKFVCTMPLGEPYGFYTTDPFPTAMIVFTIDGPGASQLKLKSAIISDIHGEPISCVMTSGEFRTEAGLPLADFVSSPPGEDPFVGETITFTSISTDPDGWIVDWSWDFGDGTTGSGETVTHVYELEGTYMVTLTVTDNDGETDSYTSKRVISPEPVVYGPVDLRNTHAAYRRFDISTRDPETINQFTAWVKNLNPEQETYVRVMWTITCEGEGLGELTVEGWIAPKALAKFTVDFDVLDPVWEYDPEEPARKDYEVWTTIGYADYWEGEYPHFVEGTYSGSKTNWFAVTTLP